MPQEIKSVPRTQKGFDFIIQTCTTCNAAGKLVPDVLIKTKCKHEPMCTSDIQYVNIERRIMQISDLHFFFFKFPRAERKPEPLRWCIVKWIYTTDGLICGVCDVISTPQMGGKPLIPPGFMCKAMTGCGTVLYITNQQPVVVSVSLWALPESSTLQCLVRCDGYGVTVRSCVEKNKNNKNDIGVWESVQALSHQSADQLQAPAEDWENWRKSICVR